MKLSKSSSSLKPASVSSSVPMGTKSPPRRKRELPDIETVEMTPKSTKTIRRAAPKPPPKPVPRLPAPPKPRKLARVEKEIFNPESTDEEDLETEETDSRGQRLLPGVTKRTLRRLNSMFGQRADAIIDLLETSDTDGAASLTTRTLVQTMVDVLPVAERNFRRSKGARGAMGLNQIISQIRELLHDLQSYKDRDQVGQTIVDRFVRPGFMDMAMQMTNLMVELDGQAKSKMSKTDYDKYHLTAERMRGSLADYMHRQYDEMSKGIRSSI